MIEYDVVSNALTTPKSYVARVRSRESLGFQEIAEIINGLNPTIPVATAKTVLETLVDVTKEELLGGNTVNFNNFVSFVTTLPGKLDNATDPLPSNPVNVKAKISAPFKTTLNNEASLTRVGYPVKQPSIIESLDSNYSIIGLVRSGFGMVIEGKDIGFDKTDSELGVFLKDSTDTETKQTNLSIVNPSQVVLTAAYTPVGPSFSEQTLIVRNKFTSNGSVREGVYERKVRGPVSIADANLNAIFCTGDVTSQTTVSAYTGADATVVFQIDIRPVDSVITLKMRDIDGTFGASQEILAAGSYVFDDLAADVTVTVADYDTLYANVLSYQRSMTEVVELTALTP